MSTRTQGSPQARGVSDKRRLSAVVARLFPSQGQWSEEDYFTLPETNRVVELSAGKLVIPDMPSDPHQCAVGQIYMAFHDFVRSGRLGWVRFAPLPVRLWEGKIREPDVVYLSRAHADRRGHDVWGVPDLVVEVLSPRTKASRGTEHTDRKEKFAEYAKAGVAEYWIVDLKAVAVEVYVANAGGYRLHGRFGSEETATSVLLDGLAVPLSSIIDE